MTLLQRVTQLHLAESKDPSSSSSSSSKEEAAPNGVDDTVLGTVFGTPVSVGGPTLLHLAFAAPNGAFQAARLITKLLLSACAGPPTPQRRAARRAVDAILPAAVPNQPPGALMQVAVGLRGKPPTDATEIVSTEPPNVVRTLAVLNLEELYISVFFRARTPDEDPIPVPAQNVDLLRRLVSNDVSRYLGHWFEAAYSDFAVAKERAAAAAGTNPAHPAPVAAAAAPPPLHPQRRRPRAPPPPRVTLLINAHASEAPNRLNDTPQHGFAKYAFDLDDDKDLTVLHFGPGVCNDPTMGGKKTDPVWFQEVWQGTHGREAWDTKHALEKLREKLARIYKKKFTAEHKEDKNTSERAQHALKSVKTLCPLKNPFFERVYDGLENRHGVNALQIVQAFDTDVFDDLVGRALFGPHVRKRLAARRPEAKRMFDELVENGKISYLGHVLKGLQLSEIVAVLRAAGVAVINVVDGGCRDLDGNFAACPEVSKVVDESSPATLTRMTERVDDESQASKKRRMYGGGGGARALTHRRSARRVRSAARTATRRRRRRPLTATGRAGGGGGANGTTTVTVRRGRKRQAAAAAAAAAGSTKQRRSAKRQRREHKVAAAAVL